VRAEAVATIGFACSKTIGVKGREKGKIRDEKCQHNQNALSACSLHGYRCSYDGIDGQKSVDSSLWGHRHAPKLALVCNFDQSCQNRASPLAFG